MAKEAWADGAWFGGGFYVRLIESCVRDGAPGRLVRMICADRDSAWRAGMGREPDVASAGCANLLCSGALARAGVSTVQEAIGAEAAGPWLAWAARDSSRGACTANACPPGEDAAKPAGADSWMRDEGLPVAHKAETARTIRTSSAEAERSTPCPAGRVPEENQGFPVDGLPGPYRPSGGRVPEGREYWARGLRTGTGLFWAAVAAAGAATPGPDRWAETAARRSPPSGA